MWIFILVFFVLILPLILTHNYELYRRHKDNSNGIVNHSANMREFCYWVDKSEEEIRMSLSCHNVPTATKYRFNSAEGIITFFSELPDGYVDIFYGIHTSECEGGTLLEVVQLDHFWEKNKYALLQNEFWKQKLGAIPLPYMRTKEKESPL